MSNKFEEKLEIPKIYDPVFEEGKKEEKKPPPPKKGKLGKEEPEPEPEPEPPKIDYTELLHKGPRNFVKLPLHYNIPRLCRTALETVPAPIYPDPNTLPVAEPIY